MHLCGEGRGAPGARGLATRAFLLPLGLSALVGMTVLGCSPNSDEEDPTWTPTPTAAPEISLAFSAQVGEEVFACGQSYPGLGTSGSTFSASDLRLYLSDVRLLTDSGEEVTLELVQDGIWQYDRVALLDFEDQTGACSNGTPETNTTIRGSAAGTAFSGIRFVLGVPFDLNHGDSATAPPPLNLTSMFWSWNAGYKFLKLDGTSTAISRLVFHLGSTECVANDSGTVTSCGWPNRVEVTLLDFDPTADMIVLDLAELFSDADLDVNTIDTPALCMSASTDPDCAPLFASLGLPFGDAHPPPDSQRLFRVR